MYRDLSRRALDSYGRRWRAFIIPIYFRFIIMTKLQIMKLVLFLAGLVAGIIFGVINAQIFAIIQ